MKSYTLSATKFMKDLKLSKFKKRFQAHHKVLYERDKLYGTTTIGSKGQVVIPVDARKDLGLKPGDQLVVMGKFGKALGLLKSEQMSEIVDMVMRTIAGTGLEQEFKEHIRKVYGKLPTKKSKN